MAQFFLHSGPCLPLREQHQEAQDRQSFPFLYSSRQLLGRSAPHLASALAAVLPPPRLLWVSLACHLEVTATPLWHSTLLTLRLPRIPFLTMTVKCFSLGLCTLAISRPPVFTNQAILTPRAALLAQFSNFLDQLKAPPSVHSPSSICSRSPSVHHTLTPVPSSFPALETHAGVSVPVLTVSPLVCPLCPPPPVHQVGALILLPFSTPLLSPTLGHPPPRSPSLGWYPGTGGPPPTYTSKMY